MGDLFDPDKFLKISHRGQSKKYPENTIPAFQNAIDNGADMIELDLFLSKDNRLVVIHDPYIDEASTGKGLIKQYTLEELKKINFNKKNPKRGRVTIATLEEVIEKVRGKVVLNIEIKNYLNMNEGIERFLVAKLWDLNFMDDVIISSFDHTILKRFKKLEPEIMTGMLYSSAWLHFKEEVKDLKVDALFPAINGIDIGQLKWAKEKNLKVFPWVAKDRTIISILYKTGLINGIMVDDMDLFDYLFL